MKKSLIVMVMCISLSLCCFACSSDFNSYKESAKEQITTYMLAYGQIAEETLNECLSEIESAESKEDVDKAINSAKGKVLSEYKDSVKAKLQSYGDFDYGEFIGQIESANSKEKVDEIFNSAKEAILSEYKEYAKAKVKEYADEAVIDAFQLRYVDIVQEAVDKSVVQIDAAKSIEEVDKAVNKAKDTIGIQEPNKIPEKGKSIKFENNNFTQINIDSDHSFEQSYIITSDESLEAVYREFGISKEAQSSFDKYNDEYFEENALILCFYYAKGSYNKKTKSCYIYKDKMYVEKTDLIPKSITEDVIYTIDDISDFTVDGIEVKKEEAKDITDVRVFFTLTIIDEGYSYENNETKMEGQIAYPKYKSKRYYGEISGIEENNVIIRSYAELEKFFDEYSISKLDSLDFYEQYNEGYFEDNALVLCVFWEKDARVERQIKTIMIYNNSMSIQVYCNPPQEIVMPNGYYAMNNDIYFCLDIIEMEKVYLSEIEHISRGELDNLGYTKNGNIEYNVAFCDLNLGTNKVDEYQKNRFIESYKEWTENISFFTQFDLSYEEEFFEANDLIVLTGNIENIGSVMTDIQLQIKDNVAWVEANRRAGITDGYPNGYLVILEVSKEDFACIEKICFESEWDASDILSLL